MGRSYGRHRLATHPRAPLTALNWLFSGLCGRELYGSKYDAALDEAVLLLTPSDARLYAPASFTVPQGHCQRGAQD